MMPSVLLRRGAPATLKQVWKQQSATFALFEMASDVFPIKLENDVFVKKDHPLFVGDEVLKKLGQVQEQRVKEVRACGPWLASDVLESVAAADKEEEVLQSDLLLSKIADAQTARAKELIEANPRDFPGASGYYDVVDDVRDQFMETIQHVQSLRIESYDEPKLWQETNIHDGTMAKDVPPIKTVGAKNEMNTTKPSMDADTLLQKLQDISKMRMEGFNDDLPEKPKHAA